MKGVFLPSILQFYPFSSKNSPFSGILLVCSIGEKGRQNYPLSSGLPERNTGFWKKTVVFSENIMEFGRKHPDIFMHLNACSLFIGDFPYPAFNLSKRCCELIINMLQLIQAPSTSFQREKHLLSAACLWMCTPVFGLFIVFQNHAERTVDRSSEGRRFRLEALCFRRFARFERMTPFGMIRIRKGWIDLKYFASFLGRFNTFYKLRSQSLAVVFYGSPIEVKQWARL